MNTKPFIHPDILITIRESLKTAETDRLETNSYTDAKRTGEEFAASVLSSLFSFREEYGAIESHFNTDRLSSEKLDDIRDKIIAMYYQRKAFNTELNINERAKAEKANKLIDLKTSIFRVFYKKRLIRYEQELSVLSSKVDLLKEVNNESYINLEFKYESENMKDIFSDLSSSFATLKSSKKIWDVTFTQLNLDTKAAAQTSITRNEVTVDFEGLNIITTKYKTLHFENYNGGDFYFYPNFIVYFKNSDEIALLDYSDLYILFTNQQFLEEKNDIPEDSQILGETWYRVNKDGSPDKRFASNYRIPIVKYGSLHFKTESGINEMYYISNASKAEHFVSQYNRYQSLVRRFR